MERVVALDPKNDEAHFQLGALYDENKNKDKSIASMKKAIELNPKNAAGAQLSGLHLGGDGRAVGRSRRIDSARRSRSQPNDGFYIDSLGWVYYQKGDYPRAVEQLERAVELTVDDPTIIEHLGDAYEKARPADRAVVRYREALKHTKEAEQTKRMREKIQRLEKKI